MSEMIELKLEDFQRLVEENENLQILIIDKNKRIEFLENRVNECEEEINIHTQSEIANNKQFGRHQEVSEQDKINYFEKFNTD
jgi:uncharacterized protein